MTPAWARPWRYSSLAPAEQPRWALAFSLMIAAIPAVQLLPLPPFVWTSLPGREPLDFDVAPADVVRQDHQHVRRRPGPNGDPGGRARGDSLRRQRGRQEDEREDSSCEARPRCEARQVAVHPQLDAKAGNRTPWTSVVGPRSPPRIALRKPQTRTFQGLARCSPRSGGAQIEWKSVGKGVLSAP